MEKLRTINLKGKDYVPVDARVEYFRDSFLRGAIQTEVKFLDETVYFQAKVIPDTTLPDRYFTAHSFGELGKDKAFEKLETVAVGRALAFMGIGIAEGGIASADEVRRYAKKTSNIQAKTGTGPENVMACETCGVQISSKVADFSLQKYNRMLCMDCQKISKQ